MQYLNISDLARTIRTSLAGRQRAHSHWLATDIGACVDADDLVIPCDDGFRASSPKATAPANAERAQELQSMLAAFDLGEEGLETLQVDDLRRLNG